MISESAVRDKRPVIEPANPGLQIRCSRYYLLTCIKRGKVSNRSHQKH